jgi:Rrf2 family protein
MLSKTGDYAVRAAISLARTRGRGYRKIREVAADMSIPIRFTPHILSMLGRACLAEAKAGREGGYRLLRPASQITLLEIVESADGPIHTDRCTLRGGPCEWENACPVHSAWVTAGKALRASLATTTLAEIARGDESLRRNSGRTRATDMHRDPLALKRRETRRGGSAGPVPDRPPT